MRSALVQYAALNLLSISTLGRSVVAGHVPASIAGRADVYDISVEDAEFIADDVLVHNCTDTLRYAVHDLLRQQFTEFSVGRKRSLYAEGEFRFFNPSTEYVFGYALVYALPSVGGRFVLARLARVGDRWHLTDVCLRETKSNGEIASAVTGLRADQYVVECPPAYFPLVRDLRSSLGNVSVIKMEGDVRVRIAAMSDWVRRHVFINPEGDGEYMRFMGDVLDYGDGSPAEKTGASAVLSGMARVIIRNGI